MTTKQIRITTVAEEIVKAYAGQDSISRGIVAMQTRVHELEREVSKLKETADRLQKFNGELQSTAVTGSKHWTNTGPVGGHDKKYWDELKEKVKEVLIELQGG